MADDLVVLAFTAMNNLHLHIPTVEGMCTLAAMVEHLALAANNAYDPADTDARDPEGRPR